jgi:transposase InsO family protein
MKSSAPRFGRARKWIADFTYIWTAEGRLYVAAVIEQNPSSAYEVLTAYWPAPGLVDTDLPRNFHPAAIRASAVDTPFGAV